MPWLGRAFQSRVERRVAVLFVTFCVIPLAVLTGIAVQIIEDQSLKVAKRHLSEGSKDYAMHLLDRLDVAQWELRRNSDAVSTGESEHASGAWRWIEPVHSPAPARGRQRPELLIRENGFEMRVFQAGHEFRGLISDAVLFAGLDHTPYGVTRCVELDGRLRRCSGDPPGEAVIQAGWSLPLSSLYDTNAQLRVTSLQAEQGALRHIGLPYRLLPYLVFLLMGCAAWWVLIQVRLRFAPIAELQQATQRIQEGDYSLPVHIRSGDEFQRLGEAFNAMTWRISRSFTTIQALAEMDRMILDGSSIDQLLRRTLALMRMLGLPPGIVWLWNFDSNTGEIYELDAAGVVQRRPAAAPSSAQPSVDSASADWSRTAPLPLEAPHALRRDGELAGLLGCQADVSMEGNQGILAELSDRISVCLTLQSRANALFHQANYDALTGLLNREAFRERVLRLTRGRHRSEGRGALIFLDLDRFKQINDTEGHHAGDRLLALLGQRLSGTLRGTDEAARMGGDEFAVLMHSITDTAEIDSLCARLIEAVNRPAEINGCVYVVEVSVGVVVCPDDGTEVDDLMRKADLAMYKAKEQSGCAVAYFDAAMNRATERRASIEARLRRAVGNRELCLYFQPKIKTTNGAVVGLEGLLRWPGAADMNPGQFIPVAEHTGLIYEFTDMLIEDSKACLDQCRGQGFSIDRVAVNISPRQFQRPGFAADFLDRLEKRGATPTDFEIEVTESVFMHDPVAVAAELNLLREAGVTIALDDFGTGYSSLNVLRELPLDVVKIDRSFVAPITHSEQARDLIGRIIDIIRSLNLESVAEGVETQEEMRVLAARHCDVVQGYLFSPAVAPDKLVEFLRRRTARPPAAAPAP